MFESLSDKITGSFRKLRGLSIITEQNVQTTLREIRLALLEADVNIHVAKDILDNIKAKALGKEVSPHLNPAQELMMVVKEELTRVLGKETVEIDLLARPPVVIMLVGLQGAGKTTHTAKLAHFLKTKKKKNALLVPMDPRRPAAKDQLEILAKQNQFAFHPSDFSQSLPEVAKEAITQAKKENLDVVVLDTAGRLSIDDELMGELKQIKDSTLITETFLVVDSMTGQEGVRVAQSFHEAVQLSGVILTKLDGDARGGAALSIKSRTGVPIKFIGVGEKVKDMEVFHPDRVASRILDLGDLQSLLERAESSIDEREAKRLEQKMKKSQLSLEDFQSQLKQIKKLGSMESILKMVPGFGQMSKQLKNMSPPDDELKRIEAIINSMTLEERRNHTILNGSRRLRIANGSGTSVQDINRFIKRFEEAQKMMKKMMKLKNPFMGF